MRQPRLRRHCDSDLDSVARLALVDQVVLADDVDGARKLTGRSFLRQLLDGQGLVVAVGRQPELSLQPEKSSVE